MLGAVREALAALEAHGTKLHAPFSADAIACWISEFWLGMEFVDLIGEPPQRVEHEAALDAVQQLLEALDARVAGSPARRRRS